MLVGQLDARRSGSSPCRRCTCGRTPGTAGRGSGPRRWPARRASTLGVTGVRVGDRRVVVHHRHRLGGAAAVVVGHDRLLAGHERLDVGDVADALGLPAGRDAHAGRHRVDRAGVDRVQERGVGAVELDQRERERLVERVLLGRRRDPRPRLDGAGGADVDEVVGELLAGVGIPLERRAITRSPLRMPMIRWSVSAVMNAPTTGPSDRLYGNWIVAWTTSVTRFPPGRHESRIDEGRLRPAPPIVSSRCTWPNFHTRGARS